MLSRKTDYLAGLVTEIASVKEEGTNGLNSKGKKSKQTRKRKRTPTTLKAGDKNDESTQTKQWTHPHLEPMVRCLTGNPKPIYRVGHYHHTILQTPLQPNVLEPDTLFHHFQINTPWIVGLPTPLYISPGPPPTSPDLMVRFLLDKEYYHRKLLKVASTYKLIEIHRSCNRPDLRAVEEDDSVQNSAAVIYAALLDRDPDPYLLLDSGYDYHFTGGSIATVNSFEGGGPLATVFKAVGHRLEEVEIIELIPSEEQTNGAMEANKTVDCSTGAPGPILEIMADTSGRCVLVRKRHAIVILQKVPSEGLENADLSNTSSRDTEWRACHRISSSIPFTSVCTIGPSSIVKFTLHICTSDYRRQLRLWQIDKEDEPELLCMERLPKMEANESTRWEAGLRGSRCIGEDNWSSVRCVDGRSVVVALDRDRIHLYWIREGSYDAVKSETSNSDQSVNSSSKLVYRGSSNLLQWTLPCERCCALEVAPAEQLIFIATDHKLLIAKVDPMDSPDLMENVCKESSNESSRDSDASDAKASSSPNQVGLLKVNVLIVFAHNLPQRPVFLSHERQIIEKTDATKDEQHFLLFGSHLPMSYGVCIFTKSYVQKLELKDSSGHHGNTSAQSKYFTRHTPLHPRTFQHAYQLAQTKGYCIGVNEPLRQRFYTCQSGMVLVPAKKGEGNGLQIVLQTSGGDLLQQTIMLDANGQESGYRKRSAYVSRESRETEHVVETLRQWHEKLLNGSKPVPYKATDFKTLKRFRDIFNYPHDPNDLKDSIFRPPVQKRKRKKRLGTTSRLASASTDSSTLPSDKEYVEKPWRQTIEEIQQYKDYLVPKVLEVWGYGGRSASGTTNIPEQIPTKLPPLKDVNERVGSWVNTASENCSLQKEELEDEPLFEELTADWKPRQPQTEQYNSAILMTSQNRIQSLFDDSGLNVFSQESCFDLGLTTLPLTEPNEGEVTRNPPRVVSSVKKKKFIKGF